MVLPLTPRAGLTAALAVAISGTVAAAEPAPSTPSGAATHAAPPPPSGAPPPLVDAQTAPADQPSAPPPPMPQWSVDTPMMMEPPPPPLPEEPDRDPILGLNVAMGLAFGGDDLLEVEFNDGSEATLAAGNGVILSLGVMATPIWIDGKVGIGVGGDAGWKYTSVSAENGTVSLNRFPFVGSAHVLVQVSRRWYLKASGGVHYETGVQLSGDGVFEGYDGDLDGRVGAMGEVGAFYAKRALGADVTLRYTAATYEVSGVTLDASNVGLFGSLHYNVL